MTIKLSNLLIDGSRLIIEALAQAGADVFIGYPITPANLLYSYGARRFPLALAAPDEITTLQWMAGFATTGQLPVTATSYPGYALMVESINMAYMMELPMVIVLAQRLGPSTGTATVGAQGDILAIDGTISGGYPLPTLCISSMKDCWTIPVEAVRWAVEMRSPVVLLTSKESIMTTRSYDLSELAPIEKVHRDYFSGDGAYRSYQPGDNLVPEFLPVGNDRHQVRITSSTHDADGILQNSTDEALNNSRRLRGKLLRNLGDYTLYEYSEMDNADTLVIAYGITAQAAREAVEQFRLAGHPVSLLIPKTMFPVPPAYLDIAAKYKNIVFAEENLTGQYCRILFGAAERPGIHKVNDIGRLITPEDIHQVLEHVHSIS